MLPKGAIMKFKVRHIPTRVATGAFILSSGLAKRQADEETATQLHGLTAGTYPLATKLSPPAFIRFVSTGEIALGAQAGLSVVGTPSTQVGPIALLSISGTL